MSVLQLSFHWMDPFHTWYRHLLLRGVWCRTILDIHKAGFIFTVEQTVDLLVIWDAMSLMWRHCNVDALVFLRPGLFVVC